MPRIWVYLRSVIVLVWSDLELANLSFTHSTIHIQQAALQGLGNLQCPQMGQQGPLGLLYRWPVIIQEACGSLFTCWQDSKSSNRASSNLQTLFQFFKHLWYCFHGPMEITGLSPESGCKKHFQRAQIQGGINRLRIWLHQYTLFAYVGSEMLGHHCRISPGRVGAGTWGSFKRLCCFASPWASESALRKINFLIVTHIAGIRSSHYYLSLYICRNKTFNT